MHESPHRQVKMHKNAIKIVAEINSTVKLKWEEVIKVCLMKVRADNEWTGREKKNSRHEAKAQKPGFRRAFMGSQIQTFFEAGKRFLGGLKVTERLEKDGNFNLTYAQRHDEIPEIKEKRKRKLQQKECVTKSSTHVP